MCKFRQINLWRLETHITFLNCERILIILAEMKIAVNTRFLLKDKLEGIGWYNYETLKRMVANHPEHEFYFLFDRSYDSSFVFGKNVTPVILFPPARHAVLWYWWFEWSIPRALKKIQPDVFLSPDGYLSLATKIPSVLVIHDLAFEHYPQFIDKVSSAYYRHFTPKYCQKATKIATVSNFSKQDIINRYKIASEKITVTYNGVKEQFQPITENEKAKVREQFSEGKEYFAYAGSLHPRKNIARLFQAFDAFKKATLAEHKLVIAGAKGWMMQEINEAYNAMQFKNEVVFTGHLNTEDLAKVIAAAKAMVYVSLFEGFGIPIIEAMKCQVPVITSNTSSMPEVAGDAALIVNPESVSAISQAMIQLNESPAICNELIKNGVTQQQKFTWDNTATQLWQLIEQAAQSK
jgi:glycosyltransferase involved in cell wall biosynthesis